MKKLLLIITLAVMLTSLLALPVGAASGFSITASDAVIAPAASADLTVTVSGNSGFAYLKLSIEYDQSALELVGVKNGSIVGGDFISGSYYVWSADKNETANGTLLTLTFKAKASAPHKSYPVKVTCVECSDYDERDVSVLTGNGSVTVSHDWGSGYASNTESHWHECVSCGESRDLEAHTPGAEASETKPQICTVCSRVLTPALGHVTHTYSDAWTSSATEHWHTCSGCAETSERAAHEYKSACDASCDICGAVRIASEHVGGTATCVSPAVCDKCGESYGEVLTEHTYDNACDTKCNYCTEGARTITHDFGNWIVAFEATTDKYGEEVRFCQVCGREDARKIPMLEDDSLDITKISLIAVAAVAAVILPAVTVVIVTKEKKKDKDKRDKAKIQK